MYFSKDVKKKIDLKDANLPIEKGMISDSATLLAYFVVISLTITETIKLFVVPL